MTQESIDFAWRIRRTLSGKVFVVFWLLAGTACALALGLNDYRARQQLVTEMKTEASNWSINGPPCPILSQADYKAAGARATRTFEFNGVQFGRRFGHTSCAVLGVKDATLRGGYPACQFTGPDVIQIATSKGSYAFAPGIGNPVTVFIPAGIPQCVMSSKFKT